MRALVPNRERFKLASSHVHRVFAHDGRATCVRAKGRQAMRRPTPLWARVLALDRCTRRHSQKGAARVTAPFLYVHRHVNNQNQKGRSQ